MPCQFPATISESDDATEILILSKTENASLLEEIRKLSDLWGLNIV